MGTYPFDTNIQERKSKDPIQGTKSLGEVYLPGSTTVVEEIEKVIVLSSQERPLNGFVSQEQKKPIEVLEVVFGGENPHKRLFDWFLALDRGGNISTGGLVYYIGDEALFGNEGPCVSCLDSINVTPSLLEDADGPVLDLNLLMFGVNGQSPLELESVGRSGTLKMGANMADELSPTLLVARPKTLTPNQTLVAHEMALGVMVSAYIDDPEGFTSLFRVGGDSKGMVEARVLKALESMVVDSDLPPFDPKKIDEAFSTSSKYLKNAEAASEGFQYLCSVLAEQPEVAVDLLEQFLELEPESPLELLALLKAHKHKAVSALKIIH